MTDPGERAREIVARAYVKLRWEHDAAFGGDYRTAPECAEHMWGVYTDEADSILTALSEAGYRFPEPHEAIVPVEATEEMCRAAYDAPNPEYGSLHMPFKNYRAIWAAMLTASQPPAPDQGSSE